jgi:hypothetical protein
MAAFGFTGKVNWFPGHMARATKAMKEQVRAAGDDFSPR